MILLFSLTCLTEQKERDGEGGQGSPSCSAASQIVGLDVCVHVCVRAKKNKMFWKVNIPDVYYSRSAMD